MFLNNLDQAFVIAVDWNWFYPEVCETWMPILNRLYSPYLTMEDFFNAQIASINFPGVSTPNVSQQGHEYEIQKRPGKQLDMLLDHTLSLTVKLTESYISYFVARQQYEAFLKLGNIKPLYMPNIQVSLLDDGGFETISYTYCELTPTNLSDLSMSYSARLGTFNTFTWTFRYNYYDVWVRDNSGIKTLISKEYDPYVDSDNSFINTNQPKYMNMLEPHAPISTPINMRNLKQQGQRTTLNTKMK